MEQTTDKTVVATEVEGRTVRIVQDASDDGSAFEDAGATFAAPGTPLRSLYTIQAKIGGGGMGVVYLAKDTRLGRYVALKRLNSQANASFSLRKRFLTEARAVASLSHIHIVHVYALGEDDDGPYIAMEYVAGPPSASGSRDPSLPPSSLSLDRQVAENGQYTVDEAVDLLVKITKAVAYAHQRGVIHRDLKPSNILLDATGEPKIVDFGLAQLKSAQPESKITAPGEKLLSLGYGAPEQESDASVADERADIYGLGGILYFAITGQNPRYFREQDVPAPLREVLVKALATDREQRWPSASAFLEALMAVQSRTKVEPPPAKTTWRCKWCDTVNPVTIRFCSECGWDGVEACPECGSENFFGMQYCGKCGSDLRAYEGMAALAAQMRSALDAGEFERVVMLSARAQGFDPSGPAGRAISRGIATSRDEARRRMLRRDQLKNDIPGEMRAENFERAKAFIAEYRSLGGPPSLFEEELASIPAMIVRRDLKRARRALRDHDFAYALELCDTLLRDVAPDDRDCLAMRRRIVSRRIVKRSLLTTGVVLAVIAIYLLSLPAAIRLAAPDPLPGGLAAFLRPARALYAADTPIARPLSLYAKAIGVEDVSGGMPDAVAQPAVAEPPELAAVRGEYAARLAEIAKATSEYDKAWREQYVTGMEELRHRQMEAGNYHELLFVNNELEQFRASGVIGAPVPDEPPDLRDLKQKYISAAEGMAAATAKNMVSATKKHLNRLSEMLSGYTREGDMAAAALVDAEYNAVSESQRFKEAEAYLAASETASAADAGKVAVLRAGSLKDLDPIRQKFEQELAEAESAYAKRMKDWPAKYNDALAHLLQDYQTAGDFPGWTAARDEADRFEIDRTLREADIVAATDKLAALQRNHMALLARYREDRAKSIAKAASDAETALKDLRARFTKAKDMDSAGVVNDEIRRIGELQEVVSARSELAAAKPPAAPAP